MKTSGRKVGMQCMRDDELEHVELAAELTPEPLMNICLGLWSFKVLAAAHELGVFQATAGPGSTMEGLCRRTGLAQRAADVLLTACTALGLVERHGERYLNSAVAEEYLLPGKPYYFGNWLTHTDRRGYPAWQHLAHALRQNRPVTWSPGEQSTPFSGEDAALREVFQHGIHSLSRTTARALTQKAPAAIGKQVLDIGGGTGAYALELCRHDPQVQVTIYDLPEVCELARRALADTPLLDSRIRLYPGDFLAQDLPTGYDTVLLSMILHDWQPDTCRALLRKCYDALQPNGRVVISELFVHDDKTGPLDAALMGVNMFVRMDGKNYTRSEYLEFLKDAGFTAPEFVPFSAPSANGILIAVRP